MSRYPFRLNRLCAALAASLGGGIALAQPAEAPAPDAAAQNSAAVEAWQETGGAAPQLVPQPDGTTRLEWRLTGSVDAYENRVKTAGNAVVSQR